MRPVMTHSSDAACIFFSLLLDFVQNHLPNKMSLSHNNKAADTDGDGMVDKSEFQQMFDLDGDGQLSKHELEKAAKLFAMVDKDGDGQLTEEELKQVHLFFDPVFLTIRLKSCTDAPRALL